MRLIQFKSAASAVYFHGYLLGYQRLDTNIKIGIGACLPPINAASSSACRSVALLKPKHHALTARFRAYLAAYRSFAYQAAVAQQR